MNDTNKINPELQKLIKKLLTTSLTKNKIFLLKTVRSDPVKKSEFTSLMKLKFFNPKDRMSLPLLSYHINGNHKTPGLIELGLMDKTFINKTKTKALYQITELGEYVLDMIKE